MMDEQARELEKNMVEIWGPAGNYRNGSAGERRAPLIMELTGRPCTINDYGSGTGRGAVTLRKAGYAVHMVDIAENALEEEAKEMLRKYTPAEFSFTHAALWELPMDFPRSEWGICIGTLQLIPRDKISDALYEMWATCANFFCDIIGWQEHRCNRDIHPTIEPPEWWIGTLTEYWSHVTRVPNEESDRRFNFICKRGH
jgi:hypothetical protein